MATSMNGESLTKYPKNSLRTVKLSICLYTLYIHICERAMITFMITFGAVQKKNNKNKSKKHL